MKTELPVSATNHEMALIVVRALHDLCSPLTDRKLEADGYLAKEVRKTERTPKRTLLLAYLKAVAMLEAAGHENIF